MPRKMNVSIVIVSWNTKKILRNCLASIYTQTAESVEFEVIVVDNASNDDSVQMVEKEFPQVLLIQNPENRGFAAANNQGVRVSKGRYVLLLNPDTIVLDNAIAKVVSFADTSKDIAVVGCRVLNIDHTLQPTCFMYPSILNMLLSSCYLYKLFSKSHFFGRERMSWWDRNDVREVDVVTGCFMLIRREAIEQVGLMDERFFMYGEETDWCYRFKKAGHKVVYMPFAEIIHLGGESTKQVATRMMLLNKGSKLLFLRKHKGVFVYALACLLTALFFFIRVPYWLIRSLASRKNEKRERLKRAQTYVMGGFYAIVGGSGLYRAS